MKTVVVCVLGLCLAGCGEEARCGDGKLDVGETEVTCCADVGCTTGVCDAKLGCVDAWVPGCNGVAAGMCSAEASYVCMPGFAPSYDCAACGCPTGQSCQDKVCQPDELPSLEKNALGIDTDLGIEDYFAFVDAGMGKDALTFDQLIAEVDKRLRADARRSALLLGESHGSDDEQSTARAIVEKLHDKGWKFGRMGIEGGSSPIFDGGSLSDVGITAFGISGDLTNKAYCTAVEREAGTLLNTERLYVQYTGSGHTSREVCWHPEHYSICQPPHIAECLLRVGRKAIDIILWDPAIWLTTTDQALLWRAGNLLPDAAAFDAELAASLSAWDKHTMAMVQDPLYDQKLADRTTNVRFRAGTHADDVFIAFFPSVVKPKLMKTFQAVWQDPVGGAFLKEHGIRPQDCSLGWDNTPGAELTYATCTKDPYELDATLDGNTFAIKSLNTM